MIEFACETTAFSDLRLSEALGTIARLGFRYADLNINAHLNVVKIIADPRRIATEVTTDLRVYNLKLANVSLALPADLLSDDEEGRQSALDQFTALLPMLQALDIPGLTVSVLPADEDAPVVEAKSTRKAATSKAATSSKPDKTASGEPDETDPADAEAQRQRRIDALHHLITAAAPLEIRIAHDDQHFFADDNALQSVSSVLDEVPELELVTDAVMIAAKVAAQDHAEALSDLLSRTTHLRLGAAPKDFSQKQAQTLMQHLSAVEYDGMISLGVPRTEESPAPAKGESAPMSLLRQVVTLRDTLRTARDQVKVT